MAFEESYSMQSSVESRSPRRRMALERDNNGLREAQVVSVLSGQVVAREQRTRRRDVWTLE